MGIRRLFRGGGGSFTATPAPTPAPTPTPTPTPTAYQARAGFTQPYFGIYDVQPSDLATVGPSGYGFDTLVITTLQESNASSESAMVDAVFGAGMNLICWPGSQLARLANDSRVPCFMPSIDEPDINGVEADSLATTTSDIAALHAASPKPVMLGLSGFYTALGYTRNRDLLKLQADITAADLYPDLSYLGAGPSLVPLWGKTQTETFSEACAGILTTANGAILKQLRRFKQTVTGAVVDQGVTGRSYGAWFSIGDYDGSGSAVPDTPMGLWRQQCSALISGARSFFYFPVGVSNPFQWLRVDTSLLAKVQLFKSYVSYLHNTLGLLCQPAGGAYPYTVRYSVGGTTSGWNPNDASPTFPAPSVDDAGNPHLPAWFEGAAIVKGGTTYYLIANLDTANAHTLTDATWGISGATIAAGDLVCYQAGSQTDLLASLKGGGTGTTRNVANVTQLNAAVAASSGGDTIVCASGDYVDFHPSNVHFATPITITSANLSSKARFTAAAGSGTAGLFMSGCSGFIFDGVYINRTDHNKTNNNDAGSSTCAYFTPISQFVGCDNITIKNSKVEGTDLGASQNHCGSGTGISVVGSSNVTVTRTELTRCYDCITHNNNGTTRAQNLVVTYCDFHDYTSDMCKGIGVDGLTVQYNRGWNLITGVNDDPNTAGALYTAHCDLFQPFTDHLNQETRCSNMVCDSNIVDSRGGTERYQGATVFDSDYNGTPYDQANQTMAHQNVTISNNIGLGCSIDFIAVYNALNVTVTGNSHYLISGDSGQPTPNRMRFGYMTGSIQNNLCGSLIGDNGQLPWLDPSNTISAHAGNTVDVTASTITSAQADTILSNWIAAHRP